MSPVRPWEYGQIDAYDWMEAQAMQRAWQTGLAEADEEAMNFSTQMAG